MKCCKARTWLIGYILIVITGIIVIAGLTAYIDPFIHYHMPLTDRYYYRLNNQRSINNGITRKFTYDGVITGTSMTENFRTSEAEKLWGGAFIKVPFSGGTFKEINENIMTALQNNNVKYVIRGIDMGYLINDKDCMREDLGQYPLYLYDHNIFNDVKYVLNRDVFFERVIPMIRNKDNLSPGITSFDEYSRWQDRYVYGINQIFPDGVEETLLADEKGLSDAEYVLTVENIRQNITDIAETHPETTFYFFLTPYSLARWQENVEEGVVYKQVEAERILIEESLKHDNIRLYSYNLMFDITSDLNNYKDANHYGSWINSLVMKYMYEGVGLLDDSNYEDYLNDELKMHLQYDYSSLNGQVDYENDYYAATLFTQQTYGVEPAVIDFRSDDVIINGAEIIDEGFEGKAGLRCLGKISRDYREGSLIREYLRDFEYIGAKLENVDFSRYHYLMFYGKKVKDHGQPTVYVYDLLGNAVAECREKFDLLDEEWHQYIIDLSGLSGTGYIIFNGGYVDSTGSKDSEYVFSNIVMY